MIDLAKDHLKKVLSSAEQIGIANIIHATMKINRAFGATAHFTHVKMKTWANL